MSFCNRAISHARKPPEPVVAIGVTATGGGERGFGVGSDAGLEGTTGVGGEVGVVGGGVTTEVGAGGGVGATGA